MKRLRTALLWTVSGLLAALFVLAGIARFTSPGFHGAFGRWGYAGWFEYLVGGVEIGAGLLLLWPRMAWRAAAVFVIVMCGAVATHLNAGEPVQAILPAVLLIPIILVGYRRHPRATLRARLQAAVNWVADRELAEEQRRQTTGPHSPRFLRSPDTSRSQTLPY